MTNSIRSVHPAPGVTIRRLCPTPNSGKRVAFIDAETKTAFGPIFFLDCPLFEGEDKETGKTALFAAPPTKPNPCPDSEQKFIPCVEWPSELRRAVTEAAAKAYRDFPGGFGPKSAPTRPNTGYQSAGRGSGYQRSNYQNNGNGRNEGPR